MALLTLFVHIHLSVSQIKQQTKNPFFHFFYSMVFWSVRVRVPICVYKFSNGKMLDSATFNLADVDGEMFTQHIHTLTHVCTYAQTMTNVSSCKRCTCQTLVQKSIWNFLIKINENVARKKRDDWNGLRKTGLALPDCAQCTQTAVIGFSINFKLDFFFPKRTTTRSIVWFRNEFLILN